MKIENVEENDLRRSLQAIEGRLEIIKFTTERDRVFEATILEVRELENLAKDVMQFDTM